ncbi:MAG TPA: MGMT family protein [Puia sp.]|jgi:methylated-DNA-protein-cysteine methyltransferase-like protein|nr:MGMT family protein [Puia sp.]
MAIRKRINPGSTHEKAQTRMNARLPIVKPSGKPEDSFFDLVHSITRQIPKGRVTTYGAIAACLGTRLSARMVGWAMISAHHANPSVPAHRVVNRNGLLTGRHHYNPPEKMQHLLEKEGLKVRDNQVVDFAIKFWDPGAEVIQHERATRRASGIED